jgi:alpha-tubulin suppressor-like RCC1 family protein
MPKTVDEDRARRRELLEQKRLVRKAIKETEDEDIKKRQQQLLQFDGVKKKNSTTSNNDKDDADTKTRLKYDTTCHLLSLPDDAIHVIYSMLSSVDLGRMVLTCKHLNIALTSARLYFLLCRLSKTTTTSISPSIHHKNVYEGWCGSEQDVQELIEDSIIAGGDTGRILPRGKFAKKTNNEFISYARFIEDAICGYNHLSSSVAIEESDDDDDDDDDDDNNDGSCDNNDNKAINKSIKQKKLIFLPKHTQGRFASCSPEHTVCRVGGDGLRCGAGGSGVATWGIGRRGQLGHGKREDERYPKRIVSGTTTTTTTTIKPKTIKLNNTSIVSTKTSIDSPLGYSTRIVQVSAGGGLVRVAQTLLLTDTGRVMSFGTGQYGALGHGLSAAKQLPDVLKPSYINGPLENVKCICVSAGELHCAVVTSDGDVYTWGDGFCGQLGHGNKRPQLTPKQVTVGGIEDEIVSSISCGCRHTLAVTEDGEVYSWGLGHYGVLGRSYTPFEYDAQAAVTQITNDNDDENDLDVNRVIAGADAAAAVAHQHPNNPSESDIAAEIAAQIDLIANLSLDDSSDQCVPKAIDSLKGIFIVGASAGHRHSMLLDNYGGLYTFGAGYGGCLGHSDTATQMYPCRIQSFDDDNVKIHQMSAGVDISMAVSTSGDVYSWGKMDGGRIGLGIGKNNVTIPRRVVLTNNPLNELSNDGNNGNHNSYTARVRSCLSHKAVDVECGYVHSIIVGLNGTIHLCGGVGVDGEDDGQKQQQQQQNYDSHATSSTSAIPSKVTSGRPVQIPDFNIWHRLSEPTEFIKQREKWKKYGKYEVKGRSKNMNNDD